jgi:predicted O-methyltransferase YrrM
MNFTEDWFSVESCGVLASLALSVRDLAGDVVEIGSWEGRSTLALAAAVAPDPVHAIDTWCGSPGEPSESLAAGRDVYATFLANTEGRNIIPHRMGWREYLGSTDRPLKFVFIDAEHSYREVYDTIETVLPRMVPGGVICGDDQHHPPVKEAVIEWFGPSTSVKATVWWRKT